MASTPKIYTLDSEVAALVADLIAAGKPLEVPVGEKTYLLHVKQTAPPTDFWAAYDEAATLEALEGSLGVLKDIDADAVIDCATNGSKTHRLTLPSANPWLI